MVEMSVQDLKKENKQKTVVSIYTGTSLVQPLEQIITEILPDVRSISILDNSLISEVIQAGGLTKRVMKKMLQYCEIAANEGADLILETCSSIGETVDFIQPYFEIPIVRIDRAMLEKAVDMASVIGVLGTVATTLDPTIRLMKQIAEEKNKELTSVSGLVEGAFEALTAGDGVTHDRLLREKALELVQTCDVLVLAQGSMARMEQPLAETVGKPVLSSPRIGIESIKTYLQN